MKVENLRIAVQSSGRLKDATLVYLKSLGLKFDGVNSRKLISTCENKPIEIVYVRHRDIVQLVETGVVDYGVVGANILLELGSDVEQVVKLNFAKCSLVIAVPKNSPMKTFKDLEGMRVATSYPNSLKKFLDDQSIKAIIVQLRGSIEVAIALNLAEAICDITQTGKTLWENGLAVIGEVFSSQAVLIKSPATKYKNNLLTNNYYEKILLQ
ncbi:MAG: ATP phosphoribosyltransferase [uncultured bacterium]|nr:MAG: ATP phosphoribosyltransferase [uncultured bacterium]